MSQMTNVHVIPFGENIDPKRLMLDIYNEMGDVKAAVVIYLDEDGGINTGWSSAPITERLGMMEFAKARMIEWSYDD